MFHTLIIHIQRLQSTFDCCVSTAAVEVKESQAVGGRWTDNATDSRTSQTCCCYRDELKSLHSRGLRERNRVGDGRNEGKAGQDGRGATPKAEEHSISPGNSTICDGWRWHGAADNAAGTMWMHAVVVEGEWV